MWLFYAPVAVWVTCLAVRHRGLTTITAANPGIPNGGTVGESKAAILARLPPEWTIPWIAVPAGDGPGRTRAVMDLVLERGWTFPLILKPDVGQRGVGVRLVRSVREVRDYFERTPRAVIVQPYHEGPFEAGIFYYRLPGWRRGRVLSITDKEFPAVTGDGHSTLEELIRAHPRYRMQASLFLRRYKAMRDRIPTLGERVALGIAGNHAQGAMFRDGRHLLTPALRQRIDAIARSYPGFFVGRFDVRYRDVATFKAGRDLAIVELNGATAESTNIYDPHASLLSAYRTLFRQWSIIFAIGAANRCGGASVTPIARLLSLARAHWRTPVAFELSD